jgi:2-isopropylmalate synthase
MVQQEADATGQEVSSARIRELFETELLSVPRGWKLRGYDSRSERQHTVGRFQIEGGQGIRELVGEGQGLIEALVDALNNTSGAHVAVSAFEEHAVSPGTTAFALASVVVEADGRQSAACSMDEDSAVATLQAVLSAAGRVVEADERVFRAAV